MSKIEKISALLGDILLPLIGFLFWDWGLYFIFLFVILDKLSKLLFLNVRLKHHSDLRNRMTFFSFIVFAFLLFEGILMHVCVYFIFPDYSFLYGLMEFWTYEELGIQQGPLLIPLLLFSEWMACKRDVKNPYYDAKKTIHLQIRQSFYRVLFLFLLASVCLFVLVPESFMVVAFLIASLIILLVDFQSMFSRFKKAKKGSSK